MGDVIKLPPYDCVKGRSLNVHAEYATLRKTSGMKLWIKKRYAKQSGRCFYCHELLKGKRLNVEHVTPRSRGGSNDSKNLVLACSSCNKAKGSSVINPDSVKQNAETIKRLHKADAKEYSSELSYQEALGAKFRDMF